MSKNSKLATKLRKARAMKGQKGPSATEKKHKKVRTWYNETSPTFWKKPKEAKKSRSDDERQALEFFRLLKVEQDKAQRLHRMRADMD